MRFRSRELIALSLAVLLAACGGEAPPAATPATTPAATPATPAASDSTAAGPTGLPRSTAPAGARLYFVEPRDGATLSSPVHIVFGLDGMDVVPAGNAAPASGHHHLIIDAPLPGLDKPIPADERHVHFGDGRTATDLELAPGEHTLQLLLGDHLHIPHDPPVASEQITITVE